MAINDDMTNEQRAAVVVAVGSLTNTLDNAAQLIDILARTLLTVLDCGGRELLPPESAAEFDALIGDAGVQATEFHNVARVSRESLRSLE